MPIAGRRIEPTRRAGANNSAPCIAMVPAGSATASGSAPGASAEDTGPPPCSALSGAVELGLDGREGGGQAGGQIAHRDDQAGGDQGRDEAVFNRRRARLILHETVPESVHG